MRATCPNNPEHKKFVTTAHVTQTWVVNEHGDFLELVDTDDVTHKPDPLNEWVCIECGIEAEVED